MSRLQRIDKLSPERSLNGPDLNSTPLSRQSSLQQELEAQEVCNICTRMQRSVSGLKCLLIRYKIACMLQHLKYSA